MIPQHLRSADATAVARLLRWLPDVAFAFDDEARLLSWNEATERRVNVPPDGLAAVDAFDLFAPEDRARLRTRAASAAFDGVPVTAATSLVAAGGTLDVEATFVSLSLDDGAVFVCRCLETDPVETGHDAEPGFLREFVDTIDAAFFVLEPDYSEIIYANEACSELYGVDRERLWDDPLSWMTNVHPADEPRLLADMADQRADEMGGIQEQEFRIRHPSRGIRWLNTSIYPLRDDGGETVHIAGLATDVTERRRQAARLEVLHRILRHNLRNKVGVIEGYADLLAEQAGRSSVEHLYEPIRQATAELESMSEHASKLHEAVNRDPGSVVAADVSSIVARLADVLGDEYPEATVRVDAASAPVDSRLELAVREGMENAIRHTDSSVVGVSAVVDSPGEWVRITIEDEGPGIPDIEKVVIRSAEETVLQHGSGLGLWFIDWLVQHLGGEFAIRTNDAGGTRLELIVPRLEPSPTQ